MSRAVFGGLPQTFSLPPDRGTADQVIASNGDGTTMWASGGGGGGGSGTVTSVAAGPYCEVSGTPTVAPVIGLNIIPAGTVGTNGQVLSATATANELAWIDQAAGVTSITQGANIVVSTAAPASAAVPAISMPILNDPPTAGQIVGFSGTNTLAWVNNPADGVAQVKPGFNTTIGGSASIPTVNVVVTGTYAANEVVGSTDGGVTLAWVNNPADGVTSIVAGDGIDVNNTTPAAPIISVAVRPNSFVANNVGTSVNQVDLNVGACPTAGYVLSSSPGGGSGSTTAPTLTWVDPLATLSATAPVALVAGVISLPISGGWSAENNVVKSGNGSTLEWGSDSAGTGTVTEVITNPPLSVATASTTPTITLNLGNSFENDSSNVLALKTTIAQVDGYYLTAVGTDGFLNWTAPPAAGGVDSVAAGFGITVDDTTATAPIVSLLVSGTPAAGNVVQYVAPLAPALVGTLEWASGGGIASISAGAGILIDTDAPASPTAPTITASITPDSFLTKSAGNGFQLDLNAPACPTTGFVLSSTAGGGASAVAPVLSWIAPPTAIATQIVNITTLPVWTIGCQPSGTITYSSYAGYSTTTLGNMSTYNGLSGVYLSCTADCPVGVSITMNTANFQLQPPIYASIPSQNQPYFNGILYNMTTGYNLFGFWQIRSDTSAYWQTNNDEAALNPPVTGDLLYLDILPFVYVNA